jgi:NAD(P)-dependent dehydrogenase (short-subunit alcohol dehydrogenase family)
MRRKGKIALISGAASGKGAATTRMFAREGAKVVIADMLAHEGRQVADAIGAAARFQALDVTKEENGEAVVGEIGGSSASRISWSTMPASPAAPNRIFTAPMPDIASWPSMRPAGSLASSTPFRQ